MNRIGTITLSVLCCSIFAIEWKGTPGPSAAPVWQSSEGPVVQIGVRDKYGSLGRYDAVFEVRSSKGGAYKALKHVRGDGWGFVYFPEDFPTYAQPGKYTWRCLVKARVVATGNFEYGNKGGYAGSLNIGPR